MNHTLGFDRLERSLAEDLGLFALILSVPLRLMNYSDHLRFRIERPDVNGSSPDTTWPSVATPTSDLPAPLINIAAAFSDSWKREVQPFDDEAEDFVLGPNIFSRPSVDVRDRVRVLMPTYTEAARHSFRVSVLWLSLARCPN